MTICNRYKCSHCENVFYYPIKWGDGSDATEDNTVICPKCGNYAIKKSDHIINWVHKID